MPFHNAETNKYRRSSAVISFVVFTLCVSAPYGLAQAPKTQREYDTQQANSVVALRNVPGLLTPEMLKNYSAIEKEMRSVLASGNNGRNGKEADKILKNGLQYLVLKLSELDVQDNPQALEVARKKIEGVISKAGSLISNADDKKRFRQTVCEAAYPFVEQLLQSNLLARSLGMEILLSMEVVQPRGGKRMVVFDQVDKALLRILTDPKQPDAVKLRAATSVKRFLAKADATPLIENALAKALIDELQRKFVSYEYQNTLIMALENVHAPRQLVSPRSPIVMCAAVQVLSDKSQHIRTRCRAARLVGRCGYDSQIKFDPIAWKIADLALDTALLYNQSKNKDDDQWLKCGWYIFTAFHAASRAERDSKGILNRDPKSEVALGAFAATKPVLKVLLTGKGALGAAAGGLNNWIQKNKPADLTYDSTCPPIKATADQPGQNG